MPFQTEGSSGESERFLVFSSLDQLPEVVDHMNLYGVNILKGNSPQEIVFSWDIKTSPHNNGIISCLREHNILSHEEAEAMTGIIENLEASLQQGFNPR